MSAVPGLGPLDRLLNAPGDLGSLLAHLPSIARNTTEMERHTSQLDEVSASLDRVAESAAALPAVRDILAEVAKATATLEPMDGRMATIEESMPVLVDV